MGVPYLMLSRFVLVFVTGAVSVTVVLAILLENVVGTNILAGADAISQTAHHNREKVRRELEIIHGDRKRHH